MSPRVQGPATADVFPAEVAVIPPIPELALPSAPPRELPTLSSRATLAQLPDGSQRLSRVRLVATRYAVFVFADSPTTPGGQDRVLALPLTADTLPTGVANPQSTSEARLTTADGTIVTWSRGHGCGCGSRLRAFNPYRDERTLQLP